MTHVYRRAAHVSPLKAAENTEGGFDDFLGGLGGEEAGAGGAGFVAAGVVGGGGGHVAAVFVGESHNPGWVEGGGGFNVEGGLGEKLGAVGDEAEVVDSEGLDGAG